MNDTQGKPRKTSNKIKAFFVVLLLTIIAGGYWWLKEPDIEPKINPNPTELFTIHGEFPFEDGYKLKINKKYISDNVECNTTFFAFGLIPAASRHKSAFIESKVEAGGRGNTYSVKVFRDEFLPGFCKWSLESISFFLVKINSEYDLELQKLPDDKTKIPDVREVDIYLASRRFGWFEFNVNNIEVNCWQDTSTDHLIGEVRCERLDENIVDALRSKYDRGGYVESSIPSKVEINFHILESVNVDY